MKRWTLHFSVAALWLGASIVAAADLATVSFSAGDRGTFPQTIAAGKAIEVDLSAIPPNTEIIRAVLRPGRDARGAFDNRINPVKVTVAESGKPVQLMPPRFLAFDATEPVAEAVKAGAGKIAFAVESLPGYRPSGTRLDVTAAMKSPRPVAPVEDVKAHHKAGQTFITWDEVNPPVKTDEITFKEWKALRERMSKDPSEVRYRIYRSTEPFTAENTADAELIDEVGPLTCWDPDYYGVSPNDDQKVPRYVIQDRQDPVPPGTGIYVHNPKNAETAYYSVSLAIDGAEDLANLITGASPAVEEKVGQGVPVAQRVEKPDEFQYVEGENILHYFVRWEAPPNCNLPSTPFDYLLAIPPEHKEPFPVGLHLHCWGGSLNGGYGWWYNAGQGALLLSTNQIPYDWWTGYHENRNTWKSWSEGVVRDYTQRRILSFLDWAGTRRKIDHSRIFTAGSSMGGSGAPNFGIRHADRIAWVVSWVGVHTPARSPQFRGSYEQVYGKVDWGLKFQDGKTAAFDFYDDVWFLKQDPSRDAPLICFSNGKNDGAIGWPQARDFWATLQETHQPHVFVWGQAGHGQRALLPGQHPGERELGLDVRLDRTLPAFSRCSLDNNPGDGDPKDGDDKGQSNLHLIWDSDDASIVDEPDRWAMTLRLNAESPKPQCTVDVTPRRCQQFRAKPGAGFEWTNTESSGSEVVQTGSVTADKWGLVTVPKVSVSQAGNRLTITRTP